MAKKKLKIVVDHSDRKHARVSPSKLAYFDGCPGYSSKQQDAASMHPVTIEGIDCHEALDSGNWKGLKPHLRELVEICQDYVDELFTSVKDAKLHNENKLVVSSSVYGYCDLVITGDQTEGHVIDYKFGWLPVKDAEENLQGMAYVAGAFAKWTHVDKFTMHFLQPRLGVISTHTFEREHVEDILARVSYIVESVESYDSDKDPGLLKADPKNCLYCARKVKCPAFTENLRRVRPGLLPKDGDFDSPEYLSKCLDALPALTAFINEVKDQATDMRVTGGIEIPGYTMQVRRGSAKFGDASEAYETLKDIISLEEFLSCVNVSLPKLQKSVSADIDRGQKGKARKTLESTLESAGVLEFGEDVTTLRKDNK